MMSSPLLCRDPAVAVSTSVRIPSMHPALYQCMDSNTPKLNIKLKARNVELTENNEMKYKPRNAYIA